MDKDLLKIQIEKIIDENRHTFPIDEQYLLYTQSAYICYDFFKKTLQPNHNVKRIFGECWCVQKTPEEARAQLHRLYKYPEEGSREWLNRCRINDYFLTIPFEGETLEVSALSLYDNLYTLDIEDLHKLLETLQDIFDREFKGHLFE